MTHTAESGQPHPSVGVSAGGHAPHGAVADDPETLSRRRFLSNLSLALSALAGLVLSVPILAYLLSPLLNPARQRWRDLGPVDSFSIGKTVQVNFEDPSPLPWAGQVAATAAWVRRVDQNRFTAFAINCTHLGCPVNWLPDANLFMCPCHGGVYYADGSVAGGPPPRPLFQYQTRVQNGRLELLTAPVRVG